MNNENTTPATVQVVDIQFRPGQKVYYFDPNGIDCKAGDHVIIDTARGEEYGYCTAGNHKIPQSDVVAPLRPVLRIATEKDERTNEKNRELEKKAYEACQERIDADGLDMQLVSAECAFDGSKLLFFFTADDRVDFRELVKHLASTFHTRIELRQIGVRDKAKMLGGLGICGRPFCCATFLDDFQPVSIKMAKTQSLSLNPTKISGTCGRLMCCLNYEQKAYEDLLRTCPKPDSFVDTPDGRGTVCEVNLLRQKVKVRLEKNPDSIVTHKVEDIEVFRNGKAKKTDPPIPADWAPISKGGRRLRFEKIEEAPVLDAIRFRYSEEEVAQEQPVAETTDSHSEPEAKNPSPKKPGNRNRHRRGGKKPNTQKTPNAPAIASERSESKNPSPAADAPKKPNGHHRRRHHHRKPKQ